MVLPKDTVQVPRPIDLRLFIHQALSSFEMTDPGKAILFFGVVHLVAIHLPAQPFTPVDADLNQKRKPALEPQVHEAKLRMHMVEIEMLALAAFQLEFQLFGLAIAAQIVRPARFNTPENPDQAFLEMIVLDE